MAKKKAVVKPAGYEVSIKLVGARTKAGSIVLTKGDMDIIAERVQEDAGCETADKILSMLASAGLVEPREFQVYFTVRVNAATHSEAEEMATVIATAGDKMQGVAEFYLDSVDEY